MKLKLYPLILFLLFGLAAISQEHVDESKNEDHEFKRNRISMVIGHGHVFGSETTSGRNVVTIPTWGIDYVYRIDHRFGVALKSDIEIFEYIIEDNEGTHITRENPVIVSVLFTYNTKNKFAFFTGPGIEFEKNHNFFIYRIGAAYEFHIANHWDFTPEIVFDLKDGSIGSITWGIGVGKSF